MESFVESIEMSENKTESKSIRVSICSKTPRIAAKMVAEELAKTGEVIRTIHKQFMPKSMNHADAVIVAKITVPCKILARNDYMGQIMGKINNRISGICWFTWNQGSG